MKKYFKKFSIMFVMLLAVIGMGGFQNGTVANAATVGQQLLQPEAGWRRYDDIDSRIQYIGKGWSHHSSPGYYNTSETQGNCYTYSIPKIQFKFQGTKLRIISVSNSACGKEINISIDGVQQTYNGSLGGTKGWLQTLLYEKNNLNNSIHTVEISNSSDILILDAIDIDATGELKPYTEDQPIVASGISLNKAINSLQIGQVANLVATVMPYNATNKNVTWKSSDSSIATVDSTGKVTTIKEGQATITVTTADGSNLSATCTVTVTAKPIVVPPTQPTTSSAVVLNIEPEKPQIHLKERISADLVIDNIKEIAAEDVRIKYDNTKLKFLGVNEIDGIKLVKPVYKDGELRFILASKGTANIANAKKVLLTLKFQGIASGDALVDITKGKVSDGITMEKDLTDAECSQATIKIDDTVLKDVNNTGEFTLLDLAIDARHLGEDPKTLSQYNTDQVVNDAIDDDDLTEIGKYMLANPNYKLS